MKSRGVERPGARLSGKDRYRTKKPSSRPNQRSRSTGSYHSGAPFPSILSVGRVGDSNETLMTKRYASLGGLRGLAALVVLIHHCLLVSPQLSAAVDSNGMGPFEPWV